MVVEPHVKEIFPGYDPPRIRQEISLFLLAVDQCLAEKDDRHLLSLFHDGFLTWISKGIYLDPLEKAAERVYRALVARFEREPIDGLIERLGGRDLFFRLVKIYTRSFHAFSGRQLKQLEILNLLGDFTREDLKKLFAMVFRKTMAALGAQYGVMFYNDPRLQIHHQRLKGIGPVVTRGQLKDFLKDKSFDPEVVATFTHMLEAGPIKEMIENRVNGAPRSPLAGCPICRHEPALATKFAIGEECVLTEGLKVSSLICVPFTRGGEEKGKFLLVRSGPPAFSRHDLEFLKALSADISRGVENYFLYNELREMATVDALTGLFNRRHLMESIRKEHERAKRYTKQFAVIMADLDHFKQINDRYGHAAGDEVLRTFGRLLQENSRLTDILARYGGEEFMIVIPESGVEAAAQFAERLRAVLNRTRIALPGGPAIQVTASFGVCGYPRHARTVEGLLRKVDDFLYRAKERGRNRVEVAP